MIQRFLYQHRAKRELSCLISFLTEYFKEEVIQVVIFGSFLNWRFRKTSDIDVAVILRDSPQWRWSSSEEYWKVGLESPFRQNFFQQLQQFLLRLGPIHPYDIKVFTQRDLVLLEEFQSRVVGRRPARVVQGIRAGKIIFEQKEKSLWWRSKKDTTALWSF